eukprot:332613_1
MCAWYFILASALQLVSLASYICNEPYQCSNDVYACPEDIDCNILCVADSSCRNAEFICPTNANCNITCFGDYSCLGSLINASSANQRNLTVNVDGYAALNLADIYCPPAFVSVNNRKINCFINLIGKDGGYWGEANIYAANSFNQLYIKYDDTANNPLLSHADPPHIYCTNDFSAYCQFSYINSQFQCIYQDKESICNIELPNPVIIGSNITSNKKYEFKNGYIKCDDNIPCYVSCVADYSCWDAQITCPSNANCHIYCHEEFSCRYAIINGSHINERYLFVNTTNDILYRTKIYCPPPSQNLQVNCFINVMVKYDRRLTFTKIYAINSFNQVRIQLDNSKAIMSLDLPYIYCTNSLSSYCKFSYINNQFQCIYDSKDSICNVDAPNPIISGSNIVANKETEFVYGYIKCDENTPCQVNCNADFACYSSTIICPSNADCHLYCDGISGGHGCRSSTVICPLGDNDCFINYGTTIFNGYYMTVDAKNTDTGNLIINAGWAYDLQNAIIYCPLKGQCNVTVTDSTYGLKGTTIIAQETTNILSITASGKNVLENSDITCPYLPNSAKTNCIVNTFGGFAGMLKNTKIKAIESFNGVSINCNYQSSINECYQNNENPSIYCTSNYNENCPISIISNTFNQWQCVTTSDLCNSFGKHLTLLPSSSPSFSPTLFPSIFPSSSPSFIPTISPTSSPTLAPINVPTLSPTLFPTLADSYSKLRSITYQITGLANPNIYNIVDKTYTDIVTLIRMSYVEVSVYYLDDNDNKLEYRHFDIIVDKTNIDQSTLTMVSSVYYEEDSIGRLLLYMSDKKAFINYVQSLLIQYFTNNRNIQFWVQINSTEQDAQSSSFNWLLLYSIVGFMALMIFLSVAAKFVNKRANSKIDNAEWLAIFFYGLQVVDFITDINLCTEMLTHVQITEAHDNNRYMLLYISFIGCVASIIIPFIVNICIAAKIKKTVAGNRAANTYFEQKSLILVTLVVFSGSTYSSLAVVSSRVFGLSLFNSGLTLYELRKLLKMKMIAADVGLENVPQLIFKCIYSYYLGGISQNTYLSIVFSSLSLCAAVVSYFISSKSSDCCVTQYDLEMVKDERMSTEEMDKILKKKERKEELTRALCAELRIEETCIELGYVKVMSDGFVMHVIHYTSKSALKSWNEYADDMCYEQLAGKFVYRLYNDQKLKVKECFTQHFEVDHQFDVKYSKSFCSVPDVSTPLQSDNDDDEDELFQSLQLHETDMLTPFDEPDI